MKGTFFQRPLEFNLTIEGESWTQGTPISGALVVRNHGAEPASLADIRTHLAYGKLSKVRQKAEGAFKLISSSPIDASTVVAPQGQASFEWSFQTDRNCQITDSLGSLFIVYGRGEALHQLGQLELQIVPDTLIQEFLKTIQIQCRFVLKGLKSSKGWVEAKMVPPDSPAFAKLEHLALSFRFDKETLEVDYNFNVKQLEATAAAIDTKKVAKEFSQAFTPAQYRTVTGRFNHEHIEPAIREALAQVGGKSL